MSVQVVAIWSISVDVVSVNLVGSLIICLRLNSWYRLSRCLAMLSDEILPHLQKVQTGSFGGLLQATNRKGLHSVVELQYRVTQYFHQGYHS